MTEGRVALTRILAIHWYGFRQILDIDGATVVAGGFGTGKSALLDLVQYVMLGGHQWRPNRSAAGHRKSRDLVSYCLCDTNTERDGKTHYVRNSGVTIAALEFTWPGKSPARRETWGVRVQFDSATSEPKLIWFFVSSRLEWSDLAPDGVLLDEDVFRTRVRRDFDGAVFHRATDYLEEMSAPRHLHFDRTQMNKTMPKAIAFEPEENFERFIREFLLEPNPVEVREVRQSLGAHREMQARLARLNDEREFLQRIAGSHASYSLARRNAALQAHAKTVLERAEAAERLAESEARLAREIEKHSSDTIQSDHAKSELEVIISRRAEVLLSAANDPDTAKLEEWERKARMLGEKLTHLREAQRLATQQLDQRADHWIAWLRRGDTLDLEGLKPVIHIDPSHLASLREGPSRAAFHALGSLALRFHEIFLQTDALLQPARDALKGADRRLQELGRDLESIGQHQTPGTFPLFTALKQKLGGLRRTPEQLCRQVEVKPHEARWWPTLELFLGQNRYAILVDPGDYPDALRILRETAPGREGEVLVNPVEALAMNRTVMANSLATKLDVADETARAYIHHLLGDVLCVETAADLDRTDAACAITADGLLKQAPARRRLREESEPRFTLGREGLERMRRERVQEQGVVRAQRDTQERRLKDVHEWLDFGKRSGLGDATLPDRSAELPELPQLQKDFEVAKETAHLLNTPEREDRIHQLHALDQRKAELDGELALYAQARQTYLLRKTQLNEQVDSAAETLERIHQAMDLNRAQMPTDILETDLLEFLAPLLAERTVWRTRIDNAHARAADFREQARDLRNERNNLRRALSEARDEKGVRRHPQWLDHDSEEESNERWDRRLHLLVTHEIEKHQTLAAEKKREWEDRLKDQVLDKLNERLRDAEGTVRQLRQYLDRDVGRYRYRVSQKRDPAMATLWYLLDTGFEPSDDLMQGVKNEDVERAKEELMRAVETADSPHAEERALRLLDYRNYHRYDVVMEPLHGGAAISLTRSVSKMSGGENQAPFFICMLAAFHRVYDVGSQRYRQNLGMVVMDEAFSKLSGDGIEDCLALARNFQLQLLMAVPIDRLGVMHPYADTTILCRKFEHRAADGYITRIDNVPTRLSPDQVREAVE
jgi:hypothetical protein